MNNDNSYNYKNYNESTFGNSERASVVETNKAIAGSFLWMFVGALITLIVGIGCTSLVRYLILNVSTIGMVTYLVLFLVSFIIQLVLTYKLHKHTSVTMNFTKSILTFMAYSALTGFTFSFIFAYFDVAILNQVFAGISLFFLLLAALTYVFRKKINKAAGFAYMGLTTLLIASTIMLLVSMFAFNGAYFNVLYVGISILGILVFSIVTMVDIKRMHSALSYEENKKCLMIACAFDLYLDFINIFVYVLRILLVLGKNVARRD